MRWKIGQFVFCEHSQTLQKETTKVELEPLSVELLAYFCRHPNIMISRDLLITTVWNDRVVTDNAVTRVITKLRKALDDSPNTPRFIATFPKKGYKFIAPVELIPENSIQPDTLVIPTEYSDTGSDLSSQALNRSTFTLAALAVVLVLCLFFWSWPMPNSQKLASDTAYHIDALTRGTDRNIQPAISPNGRYLAYSTFNSEGMRLFIKDLENEETKEIGSQSGWSGSAAWSDDGKELVYLNTTTESCQYIRLQLDKLNLIRRQQIYSCAAGSYGKMIFSHDNSKLIYAEAPNLNSPFSIFELDANSGQTRRLPQPELILKGNSQFDLHPTENKLLISSPNKQQWLGIYSLNLDTDELKYLFELQEYTCCAIWDQTGKKVLIQGAHPAQELVSYDLTGDNKSILFQVPHTVSSPARVPHNRGYVYVGGTFNNDIYYYSFSTHQTEKIINAPSDDWLPNTTDKQMPLLFISDRSGTEEVWVKEQKTSFEYKLTNFKDGRHYFDIQWSPDTKLIAAMTINEIHLINTADGSWKRLAIPQEELMCLSWKDNNTLAFSVNENTKWNVKSYQILEGKLSNEPAKWKAVRYSTNDSDTLWLDQSNNLYFGENQEPLAAPITKTLLNKNINLVKKENFIYFVEYESNEPALFIDNLKNPKPKKLINLNNVLAYSISDIGIYYSQLASSQSNVYKILPNN